MAVGGCRRRFCRMALSRIQPYGGTVIYSFIGAKLMKLIKLKVLIYALCLLFAYYLGYCQAKVQIVEKQVEVIKYVKVQQNKILSAPPASRLELLELMRRGKL